MFFFSVDAVNCGDIITNSTGWFSSPDITGNGEYEFGAECVWVIRVPDNKILHIQFDEIDIEEGLLCSYDWLRVSNQLLQLCTARTAWSDSVIRSETSLIAESDRRGPIR